MIRVARLLTLFVALTLIVGLVGDVTAKGRHSHTRNNTVLAKEVPSNLMPPAGAVFLVELRARGDQIYTCAAKPEDLTTFAWTFKAPQATLFDDQGEVVGSHYGGPTRESQDGSKVMATVVARSDAPAKNAIPWLLLEATAHDGSGVFSTVTYIQRLKTQGGVAPTEGCDAANAGAEARVPYKATYVFFNPAAS